MNFSERLILALDFNQKDIALTWVDKMLPLVSIFKVGKQLFTACGPAVVQEIQKRGGKVFLDLKFHDIPNTVHRAVTEACKLNVFMVNVHVMGGRKMLEAAHEAILKFPTPPLLLGVTVLTSLNDADLKEVGLEKTDLAISYAELAASCGLGGVVSSVQDGKIIKEKLGKDFVVVSPGIRFESKIQNEDQSKISTVWAALNAKIDYFVLGRSIFSASSPVQTLTAIIEKHTV